MYPSKKYNILVDINGMVWGFGQNDFGQLGLGYESDTEQIQMVTGLPRIKKAICGDIFSVLIDENGSVWTCGDNTYGQLGLGTTRNVSKFQRIENIPQVISASCGAYHTTLVDINGDVWTCGRGDNYQLGYDLKEFGEVLFPYYKENGSQNWTTIPLGINMLMENRPKIIKVTCGPESTYLIDELGLVWVFGKSSRSMEFGLGGGYEIVKQPTQIMTINNIKDIICGEEHTVFIDHRGNTWGTGRLGSLGIPVRGKHYSWIPRRIENLPPIIYATCGTYNTLYLDNNYDVWVAGSNTFHKLLFETFNVRTPEMIPNLKCIDLISGSGYALFIDMEGNIWGIGDNSLGQLGLSIDEYPEVKELTRIMDIPPVVGFEDIRRKFKTKNARY